MSENQEIPKGWETASVQDIAEIIMGQSPPSATYNKEEIGLPFFQGKAEFTDLHPVAEKWCSEPNKIAISNDILLSVRAPVGTTNIADRKCCIGRGLAAIRYHHDHKFIYYYLRSIEQELDKKGTGTTFRAISGDVIKNTKLALPPLPEQHRIVAKIEELFSSLDKGIESLKTAHRQLKVYRQSVLKWAFEGKLTNKNVQEGELPEGWKCIKIEEIIQTLDQGWSPKCENRSSHSNNEWAVIKTTAVQSGYFMENENKVLPKNLKPRKQHELRSADILITRAGPRVRVGICCMVKHVRPKLINCDKVYRIKVKDEVVIPNYFAMILNSPDYSDEIEKMKTGISDSGVNLTQKGFLHIAIKLPPLEEQHAIVAEIESRLSVCDKIEESIEQSLMQSESLRQSILKRAFEGKLVPQDPNDEPASKLLERIKAEKEKTESIKRRKN